MSLKHLYILSLAILFSLLLRDLPYMNLIFIDKMWILYLLILLLVFLSSIKFQVTIVSYVTALLFLVSFVLTVLKFTFFAEAIGSLIYFSLWVLLVHKIISYFHQSS